MGVWGWRVVGGVPPTHVHMQVHARIPKHAHAHVVNMIISCKWPPPLGESLGIPYDVIHVCMCMHACVCAPVWRAPPHHPPPTSTQPPTPQGGTPGINQNSIALGTNQDISILFEDLKSVETSPPMGGCMVWWVGGLIDWWGQVKTLKISKLLTESR